MDNIVKFYSLKDIYITRLSSLIDVNGGVQASQDVMPDPMTTAETLYCLNRCGTISNNTMIDWLIKAQDTTGKWSTYEEDAWESSTTAWVIIALCSAGFRSERVLLKAADWLLTMQAPDGGFCQSDCHDEANTYATAYSCLALYLLDKQLYRDRIDKAIQWLASVQNADGGFGLLSSDISEASLTSYVGYCLSFLPNDYDINTLLEATESFLISSQLASGAWTSWFEGTDSIEGTTFSLLTLCLLNTSCKDVLERGCCYLNSHLDLNTLDSWVICSIVNLSDAISNYVD